MVKRRSARDRELDELHETLARQRRRLSAEARQAISVALANDAGRARLRAITDEEWEAAELEGEEPGGAA